MNSQLSEKTEHDLRTATGCNNCFWKPSTASKPGDQHKLAAKPCTKEIDEETGASDMQESLMHGEIAVAKHGGEWRLLNVLKTRQQRPVPSQSSRLYVVRKGVKTSRASKSVRKPDAVKHQAEPKVLMPHWQMSLT